VRLEQYSINSELFNKVYFIWWRKSHQIKENKDCGILGHEDLQVSGRLPRFKRRLFSLWRCSPARAMASSFLRFLDFTQRRNAVGRIPLDHWSARRRDLYMTTHNTHNRQISMPPAGFEPTISAGGRQQTYALDRAATGRKLIRLNWGCKMAVVTKFSDVRISKRRTGMRFYILLCKILFNYPRGQEHIFPHAQNESELYLSMRIF